MAGLEGEFVENEERGGFLVLFCLAVACFLFALRAACVGKGSFFCLLQGPFIFHSLRCETCLCAVL